MEVFGATLAHTHAMDGNDNILKEKTKILTFKWLDLLL